MISVIVPIYNTEKYLHRALDSILGQTYKNWEAILVDDGSTDGSSLIAVEYARKDSRFSIIRKTNGGQSEARNIGIEQARGEYMLFLDSDDFLHPQLMELCIDAMQRDESDIVAFTYDRTYRILGLIRHFLHLGDPTPHYKCYKQPNYLVTDNIYAYATEYSHPKDIDNRWAVKHCQEWRCLYRTKTIQGIKFINGIIYEDFPWWSEVLLNIKRCTILNLPLYFYYPNQHSDILSSKQEYKTECLRKAIEASKNIYASIPNEKRLAWERNFLCPFMNKLKKKEI